MVYLFDDTSEEYTRKYVNLLEYSHVLSYIHRAKPSDMQFYQDELKKADCIFIHRSFTDSNNPERNEVFDQVVYDISDLGEKIPLVVFSDGDREIAEFKGDSFIRQIKKSKFYEHLKSFLEDYRSTKTINLKILGYGDKSDYLLAVSEANAILSKIRFNSSEDVLLPGTIAGQELVSFVSRCQPGIGCTYSDIISDIQKGKITIGRFREIVNLIVKSFNNYGKNTHPWR